MSAWTALFSGKGKSDGPNGSSDGRNSDGGANAGGNGPNGEGRGGLARGQKDSSHVEKGSSHEEKGGSRGPRVGSRGQKGPRGLRGSSRILRDGTRNTPENNQLQGEAAAARIAELTASRRAIANTYEVERRRIENDLHDGAQQYFVAASLKLGEAELEAMDTGNAELMELLAATRERLDLGLKALRRTVHGIHPQVLRDRGLVAAVEEIAESYGPHVLVRCPYPLPTLDPSVLASAYFFCAECLTNAAKYAPHAPVTVLIMTDENLRITVTDQGPGGAVMGRGLTGMRERLAAFDGEMQLHSPQGGPTTVQASIPLMLNRGESSVVPNSDWQ